MRALFAAALCCVTAGALFCQRGPAGGRGPAPYYEDTNNLPKSPEVHADRTVTFRLFAPKANDVTAFASRSN
jgi:hypothetical protein